MSRKHSKQPTDFDRLLAERWALAQIPGHAHAKKVRALDKKIQKSYEKEVAVLVLDMAGFTRLTLERGIIHYLTMIHRMKQVCIPLVKKHKGTVVKTEADNLFAIFPHTAAAVNAAVAMEAALADGNFETPDEFDIYVSMGIGFGPVLLLDGDMWGAEFNMASKLGEDIAGHGEILLTPKARRDLKGTSYRFRRKTITISGLSFTAYLLRTTAKLRAPKKQ